MPAIPTLEQVIGAGNETGANPRIVLRDGEFIIENQTTPQASIIWGADGSLALYVSGNAIRIDADGRIVLQPGNTSGLTLEPDGSVKLGPGDVLTIGADYSFTLNANAVNLNLPTSDPAVAGALWNNGGTVQVSAG